MAEPARLYLDTARLGPMSPSAQLAVRDFVRWAGEGLSTLYCEQVLKHGWSCSDEPRRRLLPGLASWRGIGEIETLVRRVVHISGKSPVLFAGSTTSLLRLAVRSLFSRCRHVLTTDTLWPPYRALLDIESRRQRGTITTVAVRRESDVRPPSSSEFVRQMVQTSVQAGCDGLIVSSLSHDGIRIPTRRMLSEIRRASPLRLAVVDGAQEFAHIPTDLSGCECDLYAAGCHKWLGAYQPLGVGILPNPETANALLSDLVRDDVVDDPLLRFVCGLQGCGSSPLVETVNLSPLFSAWGALHDFHERQPSRWKRWRYRVANARRAAGLGRSFDWNIVPWPSSGILLLQSACGQSVVCRGSSCNASWLHWESWPPPTTEELSGCRCRMFPC